MKMTCKIDGCERPVTARGWCNPHYRRWLTHGDPLAADGRKNVKRTPEHAAKVRAALIARNKARIGTPLSEETKRRMSEARRGKRHSTETRTKIGAAQRGKNANNWKGDAVGYAGLHERLVTLRGAPALHLCAHCDSQAQEWAYDHTDPNEKRNSAGRPYSTDAERYMPLCKSCHRKFDRNRDRRAA